MSRRFPFWLLLLLTGLGFGQGGWAAPASPFQVRPTLANDGGGWELSVAFDFPPRHYLYADRLAFGIEGRPGSPEFQLPPPSPPNGTELQPQFRERFTARHRLPGKPPEQMVLTVFLHGCDPENCYFPEVRRFRLAPGRPAVELPPDLAGTGPPEPAHWRLVADGFTVLTRPGFQDEQDLLHFLQDAGVTLTPAQQAAFPWWAAGGIAAVTLSWTALRGGQRRWWSGGLILLAVAVVSVQAHRRQPGMGHGGEQPVSLDFATDRLAEDGLAEVLSQARNEGSAVLLSLLPASPGKNPAPAGIARLSHNAGRLRQVHLQLPEAPDPRTDELCRYFAITRPPVYALLIPRKQSRPNMVPNLRPDDHCPPP